MLEGNNVILRPLRESDFDAWYRLTAEHVDVALMANGTWIPLTATAAREYWHTALIVSPDERINFAVEVDGTFVGTIALKHIDRRSQHAWLSIVLHNERLGRGYGRDAIRTLLRWAFLIQHFHRISLEVFEGNERAIRAYRAVGFVEEGRLREAQWLDGRFVDVVQMGLLQRDWQAAEHVA